MFIFLFFRHRIHELCRPIAVKLCHVINMWMNFIMQVHCPKIRGPLKNFGAKNMQNLGRFYDFDREYLRNETTHPKSERYVIENDSSRVRRNKSGELGSTIQKVGMWVWTNPNRLFLETIFQPLGGVGPWNFLHNVTDNRRRQTDASLSHKRDRSK